MAGRVVVYGGKGALGSVCAKAFQSKNYVSCRWQSTFVGRNFRGFWAKIHYKFQWVCSIDAAELDTANENIVVDLSKDLEAQQEDISAKLEAKLGTEKLDAVICVAGGWAGGNAANKGRIIVL